MIDLRISLLRKLNVLSGDHLMTGMDQRQDRELFCYLLLYRDRPHPRETLAETLWGDTASNPNSNDGRRARYQGRYGFRREKSREPGPASPRTDQSDRNSISTRNGPSQGRDGNYQIRLQAIGGDADRNVRLSEATSWFQVANRVPAQTAKEQHLRFKAPVPSLDAIHQRAWPSRKTWTGGGEQHGKRQ